MLGRVKNKFGLILAALLVLPLAACSSASVADSVEVTGEFGQPVSLRFTGESSSEDLRKSTVISGSGKEATAEDYVLSSVTFSAGVDGTPLLETTTVLVSPTDMESIPVLKNVMTGAKAGDRVVGVVSLDSAAIGLNQSALTELGLSGTDPFMVVVDVIEIAHQKATGTKHDLGTEFPALSLSDSGEPSLVFADAWTPPTELKVGVSIEGDGNVVESGDQVVFHYYGINQKTGEVFDSSWSRGAPLSYSTAPGQLIAGFTDAMVGQKVGSQVVALVPPESGYGDYLDGQSNTGDIAFVIDILLAY